MKIETMSSTPEEITTQQTKAGPTKRALCVRLPVQCYRAIRTIAVTADLTNADVIARAVGLLERELTAEGAVASDDSEPLSRPRPL